MAMGDNGYSSCHLHFGLLGSTVQQASSQLTRRSLSSLQASFSKGVIMCLQQNHGKLRFPNSSGYEQHVPGGLAVSGDKVSPKVAWISMFDHV